jgi:hypothetical protein
MAALWEDALPARQNWRRFGLMQSLEELAPLDQHLEKQHQEKTKVKNINVVEMGKFEMDTW